MDSETIRSLVTLIVLFLVLGTMFHVAKRREDNIMISVILFLGLAFCVLIFAIFLGPMLFNVAYGFGFIDKLSDSDSINYSLNALLSMSIIAFTYEKVSNEKARNYK